MFCHNSEVLLYWLYLFEVLFSTPPSSLKYLGVYTRIEVSPRSRPNTCLRYCLRSNFYKLRLAKNKQLLIYTGLIYFFFKCSLRQLLQYCRIIRILGWLKDLVTNTPLPFIKKLTSLRFINSLHFHISNTDH